MNHLNAFNNYYLNWKNPNCWIPNFKRFLRGFKFAYQRITRGFCDKDIWDLNYYYLSIFADTLKYFAEHHVSFPGKGIFPDDESWTDYLKETAQIFETERESDEPDYCNLKVGLDRLYSVFYDLWD